MIITQAPLKYVQGVGIINDVGELVKKSGKSFLVLSSKTPLRLYKDIMEKSFATANVKGVFELFGGEITLAERDRVATIIKNSGDKIDAVIGLGGGKTLDAAKSVANQVNLPTICIPTIASNDAPCSALSVMYSEEGHVCDVEFYAANPSLVIVDSEIIMRSPARMLMSGVGDALATYYEARVCFEHGYGNCFGSDISNAAFAIATTCRDVLFADAYEAKLAVEKGIVNKALENIIEANSYLSSIGFESGGLSCAHSIQDAFTTIPECHDATLHGERVAFGTLSLLALENLLGLNKGRENEFDDVLNFCKKVGLPVSFKELFVTENAEEKVKGFMSVACTVEPHLYHMPPGTTPELMYDAIMIANKLGSK